MEKDAEFLKKLLAMFTVEAQEHLKAISTGLIELEKTDPEKQGELVETIFRESHSLKGAARSVNLSDIVMTCQAMENVFSALKRKKIVSSSALLDLLHQAVDGLGKHVGGEELTFSEKAALRELVRRMEREAEHEGKSEPKDTTRTETKNENAGETMPAFSRSCAEVPVAAETIRISTAKLDAILLQSEEMLSAKLAVGQRVADLRDLKKEFDLWKKEKTKNREGRGSKVKKQRTGDEGGIARPDSILSSVTTRLTALLKAAEYDQKSLGIMVDTLLEDTKKTLMLPCSSFLDIFPALARSLSKSAGKKVELTTIGGEIEIDRRILEEMKDPLIHVVRNCIDHGIEMPEEREQKKKPACGTIKLSVSSRDNKIEIAVSDDGAGIDIAKVKSAAVRNGHLAPEEADRLSSHEAALLIFRSGVTTSPIITDVSGRGLGLAIVREKVDKLNGTIMLDTTPDGGTTLRMAVPLTLATFRGVFVKVGEQLFVLPSMNVEQVARVKQSEIQTVENRETLSFGGQAISLVGLGEVLGAKTGFGGPATGDTVQVAVLGAVEKRMAFLVDEILGEQEVLVKPLGRQLSRVRNIAAATVLGNGKVAPVLNIPDLMKSAIQAGPGAYAKSLAKGLEKRRPVLVVEDSITSRTLLKNILDSAGYDVTTAVDGVDAMTALKTHEFDLVVSDVDMPRMNGFNLTTRIREDKKLSGLPVVLVTALESREDRERGVDAGANAYLVKSSFDQSNLLEVIGRLV